MKRIFFLFFILSSTFTFSQARKIVYTAELQSANEEKYPGANILIGKVKMTHDGVVLTCQKALYFRKNNFF